MIYILKLRNGGIAVLSSSEFRRHLNAHNLSTGANYQTTARQLAECAGIEAGTVVGWDTDEI
jgi:hypothetical protein